MHPKERLRLSRSENIGEATGEYMKVEGIYDM